MRSAVTICLVPEARHGPFVLHGDLAASCARAAAHGYHGVEIFARSAEELDVAQLRRLLLEHNLKLAALGTGAGWVVNRLSLTSRDAANRNHAVAFIQSMIDVGAEFGAPAIIGSMQGRAEDGVGRDQALAWLCETLRSLGMRAQAKGVPLLLEPLNRYETNLIRDVQSALSFLDAVEVVNIKLLCDMFHMNIEEVSLPKSIEAGQSRIGHVHFADSNRQAVGYGHTDMEPVLQALRRIGYSGYLSAEVFPLPNGEAAARQSMVSYQKLMAGT